MFEMVLFLLHNIDDRPTPKNVPKNCLIAFFVTSCQPAFHYNSYTGEQDDMLHGQNLRGDVGRCDLP